MELRKETMFFLRIARLGSIRFASSTRTTLNTAKQILDFMKMTLLIDAVNTLTLFLYINTFYRFRLFFPSVLNVSHHLFSLLLCNFQSIYFNRIILIVIFTNSHQANVQLCSEPCKFLQSPNAKRMCFSTLC